MHCSSLAKSTSLGTTVCSLVPSNDAETDDEGATGEGEQDGDNGDSNLPHLSHQPSIVCCGELDHLLGKRGWASATVAKALRQLPK